MPEDSEFSQPRVHPIADLLRVIMASASDWPEGGREGRGRLGYPPMMLFQGCAAGAKSRISVGRLGWLVARAVKVSNKVDVFIV